MTFVRLFVFVLISTAMSSTSNAQQCQKDKEKADKECTTEKFKSYIDQLGALQAQATSAGKDGAGNTAKSAYTNTSSQQAKLKEQIALCNQRLQGCIKSCQKEAAQNRSQNQNAQAAQNDKDTQYCESGKPEQAKKQAEAANSSMSDILTALASLLAALGLGTETETEDTDYCTQYPESSSCTTEDTATTTGSALTSGEFRTDTSGTTTDGDLGTEDSPTVAAAAQQTMSGPMSAASSPGLSSSGGGGTGTAKSGDDRGEKFDGKPKINTASGSENYGGSGGGRGAGGSASKSSSNPAASRSSTSEGTEKASQVAKAAEERLRGPASNEPLGGITSVYYLDNFTKVEKRMNMERNTLSEQ